MNLPRLLDICRAMVDPVRGRGVVWFMPRNLHLGQLAQVRRGAVRGAAAGAAAGALLLWGATWVPCWPARLRLGAAARGWLARPRAPRPLPCRGASSPTAAAAATASAPPPQVVPEGQSWEVERNILNDHFKGISIYCGRWAGGRGHG